MSPLELVWSKGGTGSFVRLAGESATVRSSCPSPPGSRIDGNLASGEAIRLKVHGSRKQEDGSFLLEGRLLDLPRDLRLKLEAALRAPTA